MKKYFLLFLVTFLALHFVIAQPGYRALIGSNHHVEPISGEDF